MSDVLEVSPRESLGKLHNRRLRAEGIVPAVLYGHGEGSVSLQLPAKTLRTVLRHGGHVVKLQGAAGGQALLQDVQWDTFQQHILHVDLLRIDAKERVKVEVPIELQGDAPGENEGGIIEHLRHEIEIEVSAANIPDVLHLGLSNLHLGETLRASDLKGMPEGAEFVGGETLVIVNCVQPAAEPDEDEETGITGAEPEVIGEKDDAESGDGEAKE